MQIATAAAGCSRLHTLPAAAGCNSVHVVIVGVLSVGACCTSMHMLHLCAGFVPAGVSQGSNCKFCAFTSYLWLQVATLCTCCNALCTCFRSVCVRSCNSAHVLHYLYMSYLQLQVATLSTCCNLCAGRDCSCRLHLSAHAPVGALTAAPGGNRKHAATLCTV